MIPPENLPDPLRSDFQHKWDAFSESLDAASLEPPRDPAILDSLARVFSFSDFVAENCIREPQMLEDLILSRDLLTPYADGEYAASLSRLTENAEDEERLGIDLRRHRRREMVRIAWRDLVGWSDIHETMGDLTTYADACIDHTLTYLYDRLCSEYGTPLGPDGTPQHLVVIAMGKLGGMELNFSSDVDLIFAYPEAGTTDGGAASMSNEEFFIRLCRRLVSIIGGASPEGLVFRVDLRLRPDGENGPLVMSFDNMEEYYERQGREWERYAWIKARIAAGDKTAGSQLLEMLRPFVFRRYLDYGAFEALRGMKQKISLEVKQKGMTENIKLGSGGIREIEFFGQAFQLIRGGVTPELQERRILHVLRTLHERDHITGEARNALEGAYVFLRITEHRLQQVADQQTHLLPTDTLGRIRLAASMGFGTWESFSPELSAHRSRVRRHFSALLSHQSDDAPEDQEGSELTPVWQSPADADRNLVLLTSLGFDRPEDVLRQLENLSNDPATRSLSSEGRKRLDRLVPLVLRAVVVSEDPIPTFSRILELVKMVQRRTSYLSLLLENPAVLTHLVRLADASPWVISFLARHPVLLDELLDPRMLYTLPGKADLVDELEGRIAQVPADDLEYQIEQLCIFKQVVVLRISAADVTGILPLMTTSDHLTELAETVVEKVLELSWDHLVGKHGTPRCVTDGRKCERGFAVVAYGKLGGIELGYGSDLDLVFLHAGAPGQTEGAPRPIENAYFFSRLGQRVIHVLTAHTRAGRLYQTDMRLRPSGDAGVLVSHIDSYRDYQMKEAWTWEHQALIKARTISGDPQLRADFDAIRRSVLARPRDEQALRAEVSDMREKMRKESAGSAPVSFDLKQDRGGIVDIEFIVQYLVLLKSHEFPRLTEWTDNVRLLETLTEIDVMDGETAQTLKITYLAYRSAVHKLSLQEKPPLATPGEFAEYREKIQRIWDALIGPRP